MCDITQFVVFSPTINISAAHLAQLFQAEIILTFDLCFVVVISISFKGVFKSMYNSLSLIYWYLSRGNHQGTLVERSYRFLNKMQDISENNLYRMRKHLNIHGAVLLLIILISLEICQLLVEIVNVLWT